MVVNSASLSPKETGVNPDEIPIGVSVNGKIIGPPRVFDLAKQHLSDKQESVEGGIAHEWASVAFALGDAGYALAKSAITFSPEPLMKAGGSFVSLGFSCPIFTTLFSTRASTEKDLHRVERVAQHFDEHGDPKIMHALAFQLEGYDQNEDIEPEFCKLDRKFYENSYCVDDPITSKNLFDAESRLKTNKEEQDGWLAKTKNFFYHIGHDFCDVMTDPNFFKDWRESWSSVGTQAVLAAQHGREKLYEKAVYQHSKFYTGFRYAANDALAEEELDDPIVRERLRLQNAKGRLVKRMRGTASSFILEHGFFIAEVANGSGDIVKACNDKDLMTGLKGAAHVFSGFMALRPMQVCGQANVDHLNNYLSERSQAANDGPEVPTA